MFYAISKPDAEIPERLFLSLEEVDHFLGQERGYTESKLKSNEKEIQAQNGTTYHLWIGIK